MRVITAPDSYKDALAATEASQAMAKGIRQVIPDAEIIECPLGDGGEGTLDAILAASNADVMWATVNDALGRPIKAKWGLVQQPGSRTAIVELAEASGLQGLTKAERDACITSTYGVGQLIKAALDHDIDNLLLTLGGSATNDGGAGMLQALGAHFHDKDGHELSPGGRALEYLAGINLEGMDPRLKSVRFEAAVDVINPLTGPDGATAVFGPQKGAAPEHVQILDNALAHYADLTAEILGKDDRYVPGSGAAGGMGYAASAYLNASLRPGIELVMELLGFEEIVKGADLLFVGEGGLDNQSLSGKTPIGVARLAKRWGVPCIALVGSLGHGWKAAHEEGITAAFALAEGPSTLAEVLPQTAAQLEARTAEIMRIWQMAVNSVSKKP